MTTTPSKFPKPPFPHANWTIIILINGENDLMDQMEQAYDQIASVGSSIGDVNFVVIFDGLTINKVDFDTPIMQRSATKDKSFPTIYYVVRYRQLTSSATPYLMLDDEIDADNLAREGALSMILERIKNDFPADNYGFIYKGHGGAGTTDVSNRIFRVDRVIRQKGETKDQLEARLKTRLNPALWEFDSYYFLDEDDDEEEEEEGKELKPLICLVFYVMVGQGDYRELTYKRMREELTPSFAKEKLGFICLDCCWGQILENARTFESVANYFVASADEMPVMGIGYAEFSGFLLKNRDIKPDELANGIVACFFKNNYNDYLSSPKWKFMGVSQTCVNLNCYVPFRDALKELVVFTMDHFDALFCVLASARKMCREYTYELDPDAYCVYNIDFVLFILNLIHFNDQFSGQSLKRATGHSFRSIIETTLPDPVKFHMLVSKAYELFYSDYLVSHMAANYLDAKPGKPFIGGNGLALTFPTTPEQFKLSIYGDDKANFDLVDFWGDLIKRFVEYKPETAVMITAVSEFYSISMDDSEEKVNAHLALLQEKVDPKWIHPENVPA